MARQGGKIEPNVQVFGLGWGSFHVYRDQVDLECQTVHSDKPDPDDCIFHTINPEDAPLFRMIANRLDEIAGKRQRRG